MSFDMGSRKEKVSNERWNARGQDERLAERERKAEAKRMRDELRAEERERKASGIMDKIISTPPLDMAPPDFRYYDDGVNPDWGGSVTGVRNFTLEELAKAYRDAMTTSLSWSIADPVVGMDGGSGIPKSVIYYTNTSLAPQVEVKEAAGPRQRPNYTYRCSSWPCQLEFTTYYGGEGIVYCPLCTSSVYLVTRSRDEQELTAPEVKPKADPKPGPRFISLEE